MVLKKIIRYYKIRKMGWSSKTNLDKGIKLTLDSYVEEVRSKRIRIRNTFIQLANISNNLAKNS